MAQNPVDDPRTATPERLREALRHDPAPLRCAAELTLRGDPDAARTLAMAVAFADPLEAASLTAVDDPVVSDALAAGALGASLSPPLREACAAALETAAVTGAALAALHELVEGPKRPPWAQATRALAAMQARASATVRAEAERLRATARQVRAGEGGTARRLSFQRDLARGAVHPVVGLMLEAEFLAGVVPPVADGLASAMVPVVLVAARAAGAATRPRVLALLQRRWGPVASLALSCAVRTPARPKDDALRVAMVGVLAAMGSREALEACARTCSEAVAAAARDELGARR